MSAPTAPATGNTSGALNPEGCLFCRGHDGGFTSREHILSEALGNIDEHVLPPGVVCDRCNNGPLARVDQELLAFEPIQMFRAERGLATKAGKPVIAKFGDTQIAWSAPGTMEVAAKSPKVVRGMRQFDAAAGVPGKLNLKSSGPMTEAKIGRMTRSIWKSALEFLYVDRGADVAFDAALDSVRTAVLDASSHGWVLVPKEMTKTESVEFAYFHDVEVDGMPAFPIKLDVFGLVFLTDALLRDYDLDMIDAVGVGEVNRWPF